MGIQNVYPVSIHAGKHLAESIRNCGHNPPLKYLYLQNCGLHEDDCEELLQSLLGCCNLEEVIMAKNTIGKAPGSLVKVIEKLCIYGKLKKLFLHDCSLPEDHWSAILESLALCKQLTYLSLSNNSIGNAGKHLAHSIKELGINPPLKQLYAHTCGLQEDDCAELFQSLLRCCNLESLSLGQNTIGKAAGNLAKVIEKLGIFGRLIKLSLTGCSVPEDQWAAILESMSLCKQLRYLYLSNNRIGNAGKHLADTFREWGVNPPLKELYVNNCGLQEDDCAELFQSLLRCCNLEEVSLGGNTIGKAVGNLAKVIEKLGTFGKLMKLYLTGCSVPEDQWAAILESMSLCKQLRYLYLSNNRIGNAGKHLADTVREWGVNPPLKELHVNNCGLQEDDCAELFQSLLRCCNLEEVSLGGNTIGKAAGNLAKVIEKLGIYGKLIKLYLSSCSVPEDQWAAILESLSLCKQLTCLYLSNNRIGNAGKHLADSIKEWGVKPPLKQLYVYNCGLHEDDCTELFQSLLGCSNITEISLSRNTIGNAAPYLVKVINNCGRTQCLQKLYLTKCSIPELEWDEILKSFGICKTITDIDLTYNELGKHLPKLTHSIRQWGDNPPLQVLDLYGCSIPEEACCDLISALFSCRRLTKLQLTGSCLGQNGLHLKRYLECITDTLEVLSLDRCSIPVDIMAQIVSVLSHCRNLRHISLPGITLTGTFSQFIPHLPLKHLDLSDTALKKEDIDHLSDIIGKKEVLNLKELVLNRNSLKSLYKEIEALLDTCIKRHPNELTVFLFQNDLSKEFVKEWISRCEGTKIKLDFDIDTEYKES